MPPNLRDQDFRGGGISATNSSPSRAAHRFSGDGMLTGVLFRGVGDNPAKIQPGLSTNTARSTPTPMPIGVNVCRRQGVPSIAALMIPPHEILSHCIRKFLRGFLLLRSCLPVSDRPITKISVANTELFFSQWTSAGHM